MPLPKSLKDKGRYYPEVFQSIEEAYQINGDCVIVFSTVKIENHEPRRRWLQVSPVVLPSEMNPEKFGIRIPPEQMREGNLPPSVVDHALCAKIS